MQVDRNVIIIGIEEYAIGALVKYGENSVLAFCDINGDKLGYTLCGKNIISYEDLKQINESYSDQLVIVIALQNYIDLTVAITTLENDNIFDYIIYDNHKVENVVTESNIIRYKLDWVNDIINEYTNLSRQYDLLEDIESFSGIVADALETYETRHIPLEYVFGKNNESLFYGNAHSLLAYAGINIEKFDLSYLPIIMHSTSSPQYIVPFKYNSACIVSGRYHVENIHKRKPYVPVFSVGPYLQYTDSLLDKMEIVKRKEENGRTLTIFLPHSTENSWVKYDKYTFINNSLQRYRENYDTILLCAYWADINKTILEYAHQIGIKIVTAGFRFDSLFNKRLKSILELSDAVLTGTFGSHVTHALSMNLPVANLIVNNEDFYVTDVNEKKSLEVSKNFYDKNEYRKEYYSLFENNFSNLEEKKKWSDKCIGYNIKRSREYIKSIFDISKEIMLDCKGDLNIYRKAVRNVYNRYDNNGELFKMKILHEAVGSYLE